MPFLSKSDELSGYRPDTWAFWRNLAVYFCAFSVIGHWLEIVYCSFMSIFGIVDADSLVWDDPMYPFLVYGVGTAIASLLLIPLKQALIQRRKNLLVAAVLFFLMTIVLCMLMELTMGFLLNQPDSTGEYPLWDNSDLPLNILDQAWLVNDVFLSALAMLYVWIIYPLCEKYLKKVPARLMNVFSVLLVFCFIVLCIVKFA